MEAKDWATIIAALLSPLIALQVQKWIETWKEGRNRKKWVYLTLMTNRHAQLSFEYVRALNMIDLEFNGDSERERNVRTAWKTYLDHLDSLPKDDDAPANAVWQQRKLELLTALLSLMGECVGYKFDAVHIQKGNYSPKGHADDEMEQRALRRMLLELLLGNRPLKMQTSLVPLNEAAAADGKKFLQIVQAIGEAYEGKRSLHVTIESPQKSDLSVNRGGN